MALILEFFCMLVNFTGIFSTFSTQFLYVLIILEGCYKILLPLDCLQCLVFI